MERMNRQHTEERLKAIWRSVIAVGACALLQACGGGTASDNRGTPLSAGQVVSASAAPKVTHYAASRFAEQATFGPTPALVAELRAKGFERWIDEQFALPFVPIDVQAAEAANSIPDPLPQSIRLNLDNELYRLSTAAPDQLRVRVMWSLSQFLVISGGAGATASAMHWANLLYRQAYGRYGELLRDVSVNPMMGAYLNNVQNRPKSPECPHCAPNENYARELMQLFSIGVIELTPDGTAKRDSRGRFVETYTQTDVEELARALTGWTWDPEPENRQPRNWPNWGKPMVPIIWPPERDPGRKVVMGKVFPAGQNQNKDLDDIVAMLMAHPNIAPFVALRLNQHLVKSDPSPAYVGRVAARFRDNGAGLAGDMKAVIKVILLDAEARRGDNPAAARNEDGKFREPMLHRMALFRGLGCKSNIAYAPEFYWSVSTQPPFNPESVFSFYAPTDRAPGSNLLAPEQRLVDARELTTRLWEPNFLRYNRTLKINDMQPLRDAGCEVDLFVNAFARSPKDFLDLLSERYFRGAMPPTLRNNLEQMIQEPTWKVGDASEGAMRMLAFALATPYFGVSK